LVRSADVGRYASLIATPLDVNSVLGHARPSSNDVRSCGDARGGREGERKGAGVSSTSPTHGGVTRRNRTRASRVGVEPRCGAGLETREVSRAASAGEPIRSQGAWCVDTLPLNPEARLRSSTRGSKADGRRKADGRSWWSGQRSCLHRCSRATTALRGRIDFEWLFQACTHLGAARRGGSAPAARSSKERSLASS